MKELNFRTFGQEHADTRDFDVGDTGALANVAHFPEGARPPEEAARGYAGEARAGTRSRTDMAGSAQTRASDQRRGTRGVRCSITNTIVTEWC